MVLTLDLEVQCDLISSPFITGNTNILPRILGFHALDDETPISLNTAAPVSGDRDLTPTAQ